MKILRKSNFELLRIIAMIMIVAHHLSYHGTFKFSADALTLSESFIRLLQLGGKIGVNIFVLISGYFLINKTKFSFSKLIKLWLQIFLYSVVIYLIFVIFSDKTISLRGLKSVFMPITSKQWWFASTYFLLYLFSPFINLFLNNLDKKTYKKLLLLMSICWCIIPTFTRTSFQSNNLIWFFYLYSLAGYIRLYKDDIKTKNIKFFVISIIIILLTWSSAICIDALSIRYSSLSKHITYFYGMQQIPIFLISLFMFLGFKNTDIKYNKFINVISSATFGVYLIHDNNLMRPFIWKKIFDISDYSNLLSLLLYSIITIAIVYIVCTLIELARINLLEKYYMKLVYKLEPKIRKINNRMLKRIN